MAGRRGVATLALVWGLAAGAPALAQRITVSPTLPKAKSEIVASPKADPVGQTGLQPEQMVHAREGVVVARIVEIVRDKEGAPTRIIMITTDGLRRYAPAGDLSFENGQARTRLTRNEVFALPEVEG